MVDKERVESGEKIDPKEAFRQMVALLSSLQGREVFAQFPHEERARISGNLTNLGKVYHNLDRELTLEEKRRTKELLGLNLTYDEIAHPEGAVARLYRDGKYLDLSKLDETYESLLAVGVRDLLSLYRPHLESFGRQSVAHLCPDLRMMVKLTRGITVRNGSNGTPETKVINTIDELREIFSDPSAQVLVQGSNMGARFLKIEPNITTRIRRRLAAWDAIVEEQQNPSAST